MGIDVNRIKLVTFLFASAITGYAGVLYAFYSQYLEPGFFNWTVSAEWLIIVFVGDMVGELFRPFALTVTIAMTASLFVALTIVPVLAYWFLRPGKPGQR